jgi:hypothetical protein
MWAPPTSEQWALVLGYSAWSNLAYMGTHSQYMRRLDISSDVTNKIATRLYISHDVLNDKRA